MPVTLLLFDALMIDGNWLLDRAYEARRAALEGIVPAGDAWAVPTYSDDLAAALRTAADRGLEGVVAKRRSSRYRAGERSPDWRKLRLVLEQEFVVGGYRRGRGGRRETFGALLVGTHDPQGRLHYAGGVGSGFTEAEAARLTGELASREVGAPPFVDPPGESDVVWVRPELVVQVRFREWTPDGRLRQPTYRGQRLDKDPADVIREP
jgi:bifunctional non-homologous end joining protein LigD